MGKRVLTAREGWAAYDTLRRALAIRFAPEPAGVEDIWRESAPDRARGLNYWTDAYLTAFSRAAGLTLVTFDRALAREAPGAVLLS